MHPHELIILGYNKSMNKKERQALSNIITTFHTFVDRLPIQYKLEYYNIYFNRILIEHFKSLQPKDGDTVTTPNRYKKSTHQQILQGVFTIPLFDLI